MRDCVGSGLLCLYTMIPLIVWLLCDDMLCEWWSVSGAVSEMVSIIFTVFLPPQALSFHFSHTQSTCMWEPYRPSRVSQITCISRVTGLLFFPPGEKSCDVFQCRDDMTPECCMLAFEMEWYIFHLTGGCSIPRVRSLSWYGDRAKKLFLTIFMASLSPWRSAVWWPWLFVISDQRTWLCYDLPGTTVTGGER